VTIELTRWSRLALVALLGAAGCGSVSTQAPVDDRRPSAASKLPPQAAQPVPAPAPAQSGQHVVKRGDTLYSIALEHGADYRDVAQWNNLDDPTKLSIGQVLRVMPPEGQSPILVGTARGAVPLEARPLEGASVALHGQGDGGNMIAPKALRLPYSEQNLALLQQGGAVAVAGAASAAPKPEPARPESTKPEPPKSAAVARDPDAIDFIWPAKGSVLAGFSEPGSKGVDIGGKPGDPVVAAAAGQVLYTGTGIPDSASSSSSATKAASAACTRTIARSW